ncbi:GNAT family N-acetyltransferase [Thalassotalea sp. 1_MG-2023]|uniref:GNAT family N-acetyltransferase n=1 Tax=Thalassotalea sp. 1_MG-2023 TaxID=3062680 RepID=UPI0026E143F2|nr:GNAT family N-acetyltransferase [Thalassotalea sp. 1_MG-2023]MDO6428566.1 GNAT family N-acetyltransferase [Thalassotalea sp. 1_MG-2023]
MKIEKALPHHYAELLSVWENSVRATHDFISEEDIAFFKPIIIEQAFPVVSLHYVKNIDNIIIGFVGTHENKIEMLFVIEAAQGKGIGKLLLQYAIDSYAVNYVDVNEQNPKAVGFYQHFGFKVTSRSPLDDLGKPFPILHLSR